MEQEYERLKDSLITIASEHFRFQKVFEKAISKLPYEERNKYISQFSWFSKKVAKALNDSNIKIVSLEGQIYDAGMAVTPLNLDEFDADDELFIYQMIEPIIMQSDSIYKTGTVVLERIKK